jgi:hypothetical protein
LAVTFRLNEDRDTIEQRGGRAANAYGDLLTRTGDADRGGIGAVGETIESSGGLTGYFQLRVVGTGVDQRFLRSGNGSNVSGGLGANTKALKIADINGQASEAEKDHGRHGQ